MRVLSLSPRREETMRGPPTRSVPAPPVCPFDSTDMSWREDAVCLTSALEASLEAESFPSSVEATRLDDMRSEKDKTSLNPI